MRRIFARNRCVAGSLARVGEGSPARAATVLEGDPELLREFIAEALEHLHNADVHILTIEMRPRDADSINAVFRAFHTIKGVAGFLALDEIQALAHESENVLDLARKGELELAGNYVDLVFEAVDTMKRLIQRVERALSKNEPMQCEEGLENLVRRLQNVANGTLSQQPGSALDVQASGKRIGEILVDGGLARRSAVMAALESQHTHEPSLLGEQLISEIIITRSQLDQALAVQAQDGGARKLGEILVSLGAATWEDINRVVSLQQEPAGERLGTILVRSGEVAAKDVARALRVQQAKPGTTEARDAIKVDAERLDQLIDLIGELVIAESMVSQSVELKGASQKLVRQFNQLDKITRELQEMGTSLRMVPIRATFQKMSRIVRDLAKKTGKKVEFITEGEDTELDKTVVDQIGDPLIHMVRNAIDHGLEASPEARTAAGKAEAGRVTLRALHKGGSIYIEIQDDGRGLNRDVILAKARERGLVREGESLSDREIYNLVFEPGFSTAKQVTDISGRGVGMDVVRRNIEGLRGQIDIQSELGKGSLFSIRLPLTLAIIDGMVVRVGNERYIVPTLSIIRSIKPMASNIVTIASRGELLVVQNDMFPLFRLHTIFDIVNAEKDPLNAIVLILENEGRRVGLLVDELLGQQQIVIKSLGDSMRGLEGVAGAAIMPDGTVGLIIDVNGIARLIGDVGPGYGNQSSAA
ncbi:MAG: chemotaxis protein CheA [Candidatus Hydrogenedentes bacterium]|nr:chemotaxis protein CheA [Candidatus Hydrogenedentota bacterium]